MPQGQFSVGRDVSLVIAVNGSPLTLPTLASFKSKQETTNQKLVLINGVTYNLRFFVSWSGSFNLERSGPVLDQYFALLESNYYQGIAEPWASITETIQEPNGYVSQYRYKNVLLSYDDAGEFAGDKSVEQMMTFVASRRIRIA